MEITKTGSAKWQGSVKEGKGWISTESKALDNQPYGFNTRFEAKNGTNPEELIAAAHSSCFSMAFSKIIGEAGFEPKSIDTTCNVTLVKEGDGFKVSKSNLKVTASIPEATAERAEQMAKDAKENCPISKLLNAEISMDFSFVQ